MNIVSTERRRRRGRAKDTETLSFCVSVLEIRKKDASHREGQGAGTERKF
jgi:hypothetical protein